MRWNPGILLGNSHVSTGSFFFCGGGGLVTFSKEGVASHLNGEYKLEVNIQGVKGRFPSLTLQNVDFHFNLILSSSLVSLRPESCWFSISREQMSCFLPGQGRVAHLAVGHTEGSITYADLQQILWFCPTHSLHLHKEQGPSIPDLSKIL